MKGMSNYLSRRSFEHFYDFVDFKTRFNDVTVLEVRMQKAIKVICKRNVKAFYIYFEQRAKNISIVSGYLQFCSTQITPLLRVVSNSVQHKYTFVCSCFE